MNLMFLTTLMKESTETSVSFFIRLFIGNSLRQNYFHFISPVKSCSQTGNIYRFCKDKGNGKSSGQ